MADRSGKVASVLMPRRPGEDDIRTFLDAQSRLPFSYPEVGATAGEWPRGYVVDHNRVRLGTGELVFECAVAALHRWQMFAINGVELCWPSAPIAVGTTVAILARAGLLWSLNACRIVYVVDEQGPLTRVGFAYGTLPAHAVRGEERFVVEWRRDSDEVFYDLLALSRPSSRWLALASPVLRRAQRRFARGSLGSMRRAVAGG